MGKLESIKKGSRIIDQIFWELFDLLQTGQSFREKDLAGKIRRRARELGAAGMAFPPIVSFGQNSAEIHHRPDGARIGRGSFLMLDYGVKVNGYCSDFTRTLFLGRPTKFHEKIYNTVLAAQKSALEKIKIGADCALVDLAARNTIAQAGLARHYNHSTGHAVGQKIHELPGFTPSSPHALSPRPSPLVMTVEPGIYLPGRFGVRIEDMVVIGRRPKPLSRVPTDFKRMVIA